jgi:hypothetical protein
MMKPRCISRRSFLQLTAAAGAATLGRHRLLASPASAVSIPKPLLNEFGYGDVQLAECPQQRQFAATQAVLMDLDEDSLLKPFRLRAGMPAPGEDLGGRYDEFA